MPLDNPLHAIRFAFPVLESIHLLGIVCGIGTAALVNLRLLGLGATESGPARLWKDTLLWTLSGLLAAVFSGFLLFSIDPEMYWMNLAFRFKMAALLAAVGFYFTFVRRAAARNGKAPITAAVSLGLYALIPLGGIAIGYV
jgi:hypothetical protein